jgi:predicted dehydrogenase
MAGQRYAIVGSGMRARMYVAAITGTHADVASLVAIADPNGGRYRLHAAAAVAAGAPAPVPYAPDDLEKMIAEQSVERVIVTTPDWTHADYVVRSLDAGADVVVEKPLTVDEAGCAAIVEATRRTGRSVVVTFNYRYSPRNSAFKELLASGAIGSITSVHFEWLLDTQHGADYFRRWHREKANSGGLLVHKASHHFDLVNWWLDDVPARVFASGGLRFYGRDNAERRGLGPRPSRGSLDEAAGDPFSLDLRAEPSLKAMYYDNEHFDGYLRDRDVFDPGITIEDNLSLVVDYAGGSSMSYSLNAHSPWEGYNVAVNGTEGRAELRVVERGSTKEGDTIDISASVHRGHGDDLRPVTEQIIVQRHWDSAREVEIIGGEGAHGGGDVRMLRDLFVGPSEDPLGRPAGYLDGVRAVAVGIAGNRSLVSGQAVRMDELRLGVPLR